MDWLQFISSIVQSLVLLAWPAAFVAAVWVFRERLNALLPLLRMKYKDLDVSFRLEKAEEEAAALPPLDEADVGQEATPEEKLRFEELVEISPRAAILELRRELENAVASLVERHGLQSSPGKPVNLMSATRLLRNNNVIDSTTSALLDDLRSIGNSAAHGRGFTMSKPEALTYRALADAVLRHLR